jgi:hypothetical protein
VWVSAGDGVYETDVMVKIVEEGRIVVEISNVETVWVSVDVDVNMIVDVRVVAGQGADGDIIVVLSSILVVETTVRVTAGKIIVARSVRVIVFVLPGSVWVIYSGDE